MKHFTADDLRSLSILEGLPEGELEWLALNSRRIDLDTGEHMFERGAVAEGLFIVVEGAIQGFEEIGGQWLLVATTTRGQVTGMLPFSRMTHYPRYTVAAEPSRVLRFEASRMNELLATSEELARRLVAEMSDRIRGDVRLEQQNEKMISLGRLSAGLAHELNNPAAAMRRAAKRLSEHRRRLPGLVTALVRHHVSPEGLGRLEEIRARGSAQPPSSLGAVARGELEEELSDWFDDRNVPEAWEVAATFAEAGLTVDQLEELEKILGRGALPDAVAWLGVGIESDRIVREIGEAAERISELVSSIETYSHMDRGSGHKPTDVRTGLDNTVTMLSHKLREKDIRLERDYDEDLPDILANPGELNQVWTNLIDNAIDAMGEGGSLALRAKSDGTWVTVEIVDSGAGIPEELRSQIFEPFFTTKEVGVGTGLGLGIARRIVRTHQGDIEVRSRPGLTRMCVRLPLERNAPE